MSRIVIALMVALVVSEPAWGETKASTFLKAIKECHEALQQESDRATEKMESGDAIGAYQDYVKASKRGNVFASLRLCIFPMSTGTKINGVDDKVIFEECRTGAHDGRVGHQYALSQYYLYGFGTDKNLKNHMYWLKRAAEQGHAESQRILGVYYASGKGVPLDWVSAYKWFNLSAAGGDKDAKMLLDAIPSKMTRDEITEGQKLSREWKTTDEDQPKLAKDAERACSKY